MSRVSYSTQQASTSRWTSQGGKLLSASEPFLTLLFLGLLPRERLVTVTILGIHGVDTQGTLGWSLVGIGLVAHHLSFPPAILPLLLAQLLPLKSHDIPRTKERRSHLTGTKTLPAHSPVSHEPLYAEILCALDPESSMEELQMPERGIVLWSLPVSAHMFW